VECEGFDTVYYKELDEEKARKVVVLLNERAKLQTHPLIKERSYAELEKRRVSVTNIVSLPNPFVTGGTKSITSERSSMVETDSLVDYSTKVNESGAEQSSEDANKSFESKINTSFNSANNSTVSGPNNGSFSHSNQNLITQSPNTNSTIRMSPPHRSFQRNSTGNFSNSGGIPRGRGSSNFGNSGYNNMGGRSFGPGRSFSRGGYSNAPQSFQRL
jgi:hypothetical protein